MQTAKNKPFPVELFMPSEQQIRQKVQERPRTMQLQEIAEGSKVSLTWLSKMLGGHIKSPGYAKMRRIWIFVASKY